MANRPEGDPGRPHLAEDDDWFRSRSVGPVEPGEVVWQDEPELLPPRQTAGARRRQAGGVMAVIVAVVLIAGGFLLVRTITGSGGTATTGSTLRTPTTPAGATPRQTSPSPTVPSVTTTPSPIAVPTAGVLRSGSTGAAVMVLQQALSTLGYAPGAADGSLGPATVTALIAFQKAHGLPQDGIAGPKTLAAINLALAP